MSDIRVLIVEDDPMVMDIHKRFVLSIPGFELVGLGANGMDGLKVLEQRSVDLVILDIYMPELDGLETLHEIRRRRRNVDVIVVSAAHETDTVRDVMRFGAFDYIVKPFTYERFKEAMEGYLLYWAQKGDLDQGAIDRIMRRGSREKRDRCLPKGLGSVQLDRVRSILMGEDGALSADEVAVRAGVSRVTARRYLEYLVSINRAAVEPLHRDVGRPVNLYRLLDAKGGDCS
ncbi:response regulator [Dethiosulfovibrio sp. F2B]|uniref:response regulator n=1 Tax=Dethiosulfovibrio faecalis TaxID=2720018 RepID=UPI001F3B2717|nr:response regulator [Dethiosulfovibrio faecalis]